MHVEQTASYQYTGTFQIEMKCVFNLRPDTFFFPEENPPAPLYFKQCMQGIF